MLRLKKKLIFDTLWYGGAPGAMGGPLVFTWRSAAVSGAQPPPNANLFTSQAIGPATSDRVIVVGISWTGTNASGMDIPVNGVKIAGINASQGAYSRPSTKGMAIYHALVTTGTTATIGVTGYSNGFIDEIIINTASMTGSIPASVGNTDMTATYSSGLTVSPSITVFNRGVSVICGVNNANVVSPVTSWTNATKDNDLWDGAGFGISGTMAHLTASATVTLNSIAGGGPGGWIVANFHP